MQTLSPQTADLAFKLSKPVIAEDEMDIGGKH